MSIKELFCFIFVYFFTKFIWLVKDKVVYETITIQRLATSNLEQIASSARVLT
jgi:hypothetical protein